jgi:hypothetical protein|tara:strand:- start:35 stop:538 length:504 start_codon:yes stop_codon:yes gene_type:complete
MRTPFKQRSSPTKGKLQDFFNTVGANLKRNKKDIGAELKKKHKGSKQTTNKAGEKIGYVDTPGFRKGMESTQETRSKWVNPAWGEPKTSTKSEVKKQIAAKTAEKATVAKTAKTAKKATVANKPNEKTTTKKKVSYADAYKNADKKKYPTLASFTTAAKAYNAKKKK